MAPHAYSPLGIFEPILLIIFTLMLLTCLAGGNAGMILKPVFELAGQLLGAFLSLLCVALSTLLRLVVSTALSLGQQLHSGLEQHSKRNSNS
jgi:hypothetical protein